MCLEGSWNIKFRTMYFSSKFKLFCWPEKTTLRVTRLHMRVQENGVNFIWLQIKQCVVKKHFLRDVNYFMNVVDLIA